MESIELTIIIVTFKSDEKMLKRTTRTNGGNYFRGSEDTL